VKNTKPQKSLASHPKSEYKHAYIEARKDMKNFRLLLLISILTALLIACGGAEETTPPTLEVTPPTLEATVPTEEPSAVASTDTPKPVDPSPTPEPVEPTASAEPTFEPTEAAPTEVAMVAFEGDECLTCHADKERLIETAALVEEAPSESSGVG
jgi:outer membrane biosynthesis protein TonB